MIKKLSLLLLLFMGVAVYADYMAVFDMNGTTQTLLYKDDKHAKLITRDGAEKSSFYLIGNKSYIVSEADGQKTVMDMEEMRKMTQAFGGAERMEPEYKGLADFKIIKTGKHENVAGIRGDVWYAVDPQTKERYRVVVTNNADVRKSLRVMDMFLSSFMDEKDREYGMFELKKGYVVIKAEGMELKKFKKKSFPAKTYELPKDATKQSMSGFAALLGGGGANSGGSKQSGAKSQGLLDKCYTEVCCGSTAGSSKVLVKMLAKRAGGYTLQGSGVCDVLGISSLFGVDDVEGALYKKGDDAIQVTLSMNSNEESSVLVAKNGNGTLQAKNYKRGTINGYTYHYAMLMPVKQQEIDIIIDSKTVLKITRLATKSEINLISWAKRAINLDAYSAPKHSQKEKSGSADESDAERESINQNVDKAVDLL